MEAKASVKSPTSRLIVFTSRALRGRWATKLKASTDKGLPAICATSRVLWEAKLAGREGV